MKLTTMQSLNVKLLRNIDGLKLFHVWGRAKNTVHIGQKLDTKRVCNYK